MTETPGQSESSLSDELISAYLDDELSADQRVQVERMLAENEQWRRMLDELQILRSSIQALPQYELDEHFSQRVLQRAERLMLSTSNGQATPAAAQRSVWRGVAWTAATVAATVLVMVFVLRDPNPSNVALSPAQLQADAGQADDEEMGKKSSRSSIVNETEELDKGSSTAPMLPSTGRQQDKLPFNKAMAARKSGRAPLKSRNRSAGPSTQSAAAMSLGLPRDKAFSPDAHLTILRVDLTSTALKQRAFDHALAQHGIHLESSTNQTDDNDVDMVYVEATAQQIDALLADLATHTDRFRILTSETANVDALKSKFAGKDQAGPLDSNESPAIEFKKGPAPGGRARRLYASPAKIPLSRRSDRPGENLEESGRSARGKLEKKSSATQPTVQVLFVLRAVESIQGAKSKQSPKEQVK